MRDRAGRLIDKARGAVPEGTFAVGAGLMIAAATSYLFVIVALNALHGTGKSAFGTYWGFIFVAGPGFFLPLEQEVGRALAHRRAQGIGGGPLVARAARLGALLTALLVITTLATAPLTVDPVFKGDALLVIALAIGLVGFYSMHLTRGTLSGNGRFRPYGEMLAVDAIVRLAASIVLAVVGVRSAGAYGMCLSLSPFTAVAFSLRHERRAQLLRPGPPAPYSELSQSIGWLLAGSVLMQLLGYFALLWVGIFHTKSEKTTAAAFTSAFFVARIPILLFQAVQGTLLPKLANLAGAGRHDDFRNGLRQLMAVVAGIAALGTVVAFTIGPPVGKILFKDFTIGNIDLGLLAAGSGVFIVTLTVAQALLALKGYAHATFAWLVGVLAFVIGAIAIADLELRVEIGFLLGSAVAGAIMVSALLARMRSGVPETIEPLLVAIEREPLEI